MLEGRRIAILIEEGFGDVELMETLTVLKAAGGQTMYRDKRGTAEVRAGANTADVDPGEFDTVVVPGCAPDRMGLHLDVIEFVRAAHDAGKTIAAIGLEPRLLISAGTARGRRLAFRRSLSSSGSGGA